MERAIVSLDDNLEFAIYLKHNRAESVTVPFAFWIEDADGEIFVHRLTTPRTFDFGDEESRSYVFPIPDNLAPGEYELKVGIRKMQQGEAWAGERLTIQGPPSHGS